MTSDINLSPYYLLVKVNKQRRVLNTQIIKKTISKHHPLCDCRKTTTVEYISLQTVFFVVKNQLELKFADLRDLVLILPEAATGGVPEVVYVTTGNAAFCLVLYLTGVHFSGELQHVGDVSE